jgi:hypothetical protein
MSYLHTTVPEVKAALYDTYIPAAIATLASTITVAGEVVDLRAPSLTYGAWAAQIPPPAWVMIGPTRSGNQTPVASFPNGAAANRAENYAVSIDIWYRVGDTSDLAQRIATESGYTVFRAIAAAVRADPSLGGILTAGHALLTAASDTEYDLAEGRGIGIACDLTVTSRV